LNEFFSNFASNHIMKYLIILFVLISFNSCYKIERDCNSYKTGDFYSETVINNKVYKSTFSRGTELQIENFEGILDSSKVRWINECEMVFKTINPKNKIERKDIHLKILITTDSSYTYEYSYIGETIKQKGIAYKIK